MATPGLALAPRYSTGTLMASAAPKTIATALITAYRDELSGNKGAETNTTLAPKQSNEWSALARLTECLTMAFGCYLNLRDIRSARKEAYVDKHLC